MPDAKRPYVICHMLSTIDGRILNARWKHLPGGAKSSELFEKTHPTFNVKAWLVGTTTMKEFAGRQRSLKKAKQRVGYDDFVAQPKAKTLAVGADAKGVLRYQSSQTHGDHVVLLVTRRVGQDYLAHLQAAGVSYLVCGEREIDLHLALRKLRDAFGLKKLMLEGGGHFNGAMLREGLVDEISHIVVPIVDGGQGVTTLFDIPGDPPRQSAAALRQISHTKLPGGANWFRYRVVRR